MRAEPSSRDSGPVPPLVAGSVHRALLPRQDRGHSTGPRVIPGLSQGTGPIAEETMASTGRENHMCQGQGSPPCLSGTGWHRPCGRADGRPTFHEDERAHISLTQTPGTTRGGARLTGNSDLRNRLGQDLKSTGVPNRTHFENASLSNPHNHRQAPAHRASRRKRNTASALLHTRGPAATLRRDPSSEGALQRNGQKQVGKPRTSAAGLSL